MSLLNELSIDNLEVLNEFDAAGFIDISNFNLGKGDESSQLSFDVKRYTDILTKSVNSLNDITLNKSIINFLSNLERYNIRANEINTSEVITINTNYLNIYIEAVAKMLDDVLKGEIGQDGVNRVIATNVVEGVKKNSVKTTFDQPNVIKLFKFHKDNEFKVVNVDNSYTRKRIAPFVNNYSSKKADLFNDTEDVIKNLQASGDKIKNIISTMNKIKMVESTPSDVKEKLTYAMYYGVRNIIEIISYITAMSIQKIDMFTRNTIICNNIASQAENSVDNINESYGAHVGVVPTDEESIGDALRGADISAYKILANNIYGLHVNNLKKPDVPEGAAEIGVSPDGQYVQGYLKYKRDVYDNIVKDLIEVGQGVDFMTGQLDQYIMISDDVINNAGFVMSLFDRYAADLNSIEDLSNYQSVLNLKPTGEILNGLYQTILSEVHDYEKNMQMIANAFQECMIRLQSLRKILTVEHNGEFNSSQAMIEIKDWIDNFEAEFGKFSGEVGVKFLNRLRALGEEINEIKAEEETPTEDDGEELDESVDFVESAYESIYDLTVLEHAYDTHMLEIEYYTEKTLLDKNKVLVTEADTVNQPNNAAGQPNQNQSTAPKVVDNNPVAGSGAGLISKIIDSISNWFNKLKEQFTATNKKLVGTPKGKAVINNMQAITSRDYTNTQVQLLPYNNIDIDTIVAAEFNKLISNVTRLSPQDIQNVKNKEDLYPKLFGFINGGIDKNASVADQIKNYYKTGDKNNAGNLTTIENQALKTFVGSKMIPYVRNYATNINNQANEAATKLNEALNAKIQSFNTVATQESVMTEAPLNQQNVNTTTSMSAKARWVSSLCQIYTGSMYNALRDRYKDYVQVLYKLIPNTVEQPQNNQVQQQANQNTEVENPVPEIQQ